MNLAPGSIACGFLVFANLAAAEASIPNDARATIGAINSAAARQDFGTLDRLMVRQFLWSFGGDRDARQALDAWREKPEYLKHLHRVTSGKCEFRTGKIVECPVKAGAGYRAGFAQTTDGWRMAYFVAGD